ncbi:MAG: DUF3883 domain-containing protein [Rubrobacteraceae bacterium]|nr:DUF3883 domain-containing protein [Rubrobacteraceae bacterium]
MRTHQDPPSRDRYPLEIAHLQVSDYFDCDLLSFTSSEHRDRFRNQDDPDENLILRFIEVKGCGSEKGAIALEGNELTAAGKYPNRFYLYSIYEIREGEFEVAVLNDPLAGNPEVAFKIDLFGETRATRWKVEIVAFRSDPWVRASTRRFDSNADSNPVDAEQHLTNVNSEKRPCT